MKSGLGCKVTDLRELIIAQLLSGQRRKERHGQHGLIASLLGYPVFSIDRWVLDGHVEYLPDRPAGCAGNLAKLSFSLRLNLAGDLGQFRRHTNPGLGRCARRRAHPKMLFPRHKRRFCPW